MGTAYIVDEAGSLLLRWGWASFLWTGDASLYNTAGLNGERKRQTATCNSSCIALCLGVFIWVEKREVHAKLYPSPPKNPAFASKVRIHPIIAKVVVFYKVYIDSKVAPGACFRITVLTVKSKNRC